MRCLPSLAGDFDVKIMGRSAIAYTLADANDPDTAHDDTTQILVQLIVDSGKALKDTFASDITLYVTDEDGFVIPMAAAAEGTNPQVFGYTITLSEDTSYASRTPSKRRLNVLITIMTDETNVADQRTVKSVRLTLPAFETPDPTVGDDDDMSKEVSHTLTLSTAVDTSMLPKVVSIQRLRPGSQTVVAAFQEERIEPTPFNVRIVLTDVPHGIDLADVNNLVEVENGTPSGLVIGVPFTRIGIDTDDSDSTTNAGDAMNTLRPHPIEGMYAHVGMGALQGVPEGFDDMTVPMPTSHDGTNTMYRQYRVTITPHQKSANFDIKIKVKEFHNNGSPIRRTYISPGFGESVNMANGRDILTIPVKGAARNLQAGYRVTVPKDWIIPANGYLIIAKDVAGSEIEAGPGPAGDWRTNDTPRATHRTPAQLKYNVIGIADLPNLATAFLNGVVVDVESQHAGLVISEVMWGEDVSLNPSSNSQYIELYNSGAQYKTIDDKDETPDVNEALTLIFYAPNEFNATRETPFDKDGKRLPDGGTRMLEDDELPKGVTDRIGTLDAKGAYWSPAAKGQSGRSGTGEAETVEGRTTPQAVPIVSMYRGMKADGSIDAMMGQMAASWMSSAGPKSANFDPLALGIRHGTPGAATDATDTPADTAAEAKAKADAAAAAQKKVDTTGTIPQNGSIYISEIMFAGGGILPQWIEIANGSKSEEVNLSGWTLTIANAAADADVSIGASATFTIPDGTKVAMSGQQKSPSTILVVTEAGRNNVDGSGQVINLMKDNEVELILAGVTKRKYTILSADAFSITLAPPEPEKKDPPKGETKDAKAKREAAEKKAAAERKAASDTVGNLGADGAAAWALPMSEDGRSSIIRRHVQVAVGPAEPEDGTMMDNWALAADTSFAQPTHIRAQSYYGAMNDVGTPGFRAGGALPVELSHFRPARDKVTDAVVITWSTQSELNNAGFFIKRSQQKDGEFKVINATMVPGAGTTSEKQFYTYTDTTAQPNVVYYYQIEDVSLDGNRQTLTRGIRLKGHVGAAGKLTSTWGELKTSHE